MKLAFPPTRPHLNSEEIHHRIHQGASANGTPIVLLHGLMGFAANWGKIWPKLIEQRPVLVLDQCGHGRSEKREKGYTPGDYAADLYALITHIGWQKIHLVGHSMGGRVAVAFCANYPQLVLSLCLEDSGMEAKPSRVQWITDLLGGIPTPFPDRQTAKDFFSKHFFGQALLQGFLFANLEEKPGGQYDWRFLKNGMIETICEGRAKDAMKEFASLHLPILLIRGGLSEEFSAEEAERMLKAQPHAELKTIPHAGHFVHAEQADDFCRHLISFLSKV